MGSSLLYHSSVMELATMLLAPMPAALLVVPKAAMFWP
jgi:hypothetical protein